MFRALMLSALMLFAVPVFAQQASPNPCANLAESTRDLGPQATTTLLESCRAKTKGFDIEQLASPEVANSWADAAKGFGQAIGIAAKELGVAANDFLDSPAGLLLAAILLFNYAGDVLLGGLVGFPFSIFSMFFWYYMVRAAATKSREYEVVPYFWGMFTRRRVKEIQYDWDDAGLWAIFGGISIVIINLIVWTHIS